MKRSPVLSIALTLSLFLTLTAPDPSWGSFFDFDEDALKTTGIIIGITAGVVLLVVLIAGTVKDIQGGEEEEEDIWADLRENRTLACFPSLLAAPVLVHDLRQAFSPPPPDPPDFPEGRIPSGIHSRKAWLRKPARFRIGGSEIHLPETGVSIANRTESSWIDSRRFALLLDERTDEETRR